MEEKSFLKGYCSKKKKYFGIELDKYGSIFEVTNFIYLKQEEAKVLTSLVRQSSFKTHSNLLPCTKTVTREISSVDGISCPEDGKYSFQCIYCKNMQIDYSSADISGTQLKAGDVIKLSQGQEIKIQLNGKSLDKIVLYTGWDPVLKGNTMDVDSSVFMIGQESSELVYFGQLNDAAKSIIHHGDNLTGENEGQNNIDETIDVNLNKIPNRYNKIAIIINIYKAHDKHQSLKNVRNLFIRLVNKEDNKPLAEYTVTHNIGSATALMIAVLTRDGDGWKFKASGIPSNVGGLTEYEEELKSLYRNNRL